MNAKSNAKRDHSTLKLSYRLVAVASISSELVTTWQYQVFLVCKFGLGGYSHDKSWKA